MKVKMNKPFVTIGLLAILALSVIATEAYGEEIEGIYGEIEYEYCYTPYGVDVHPEFIADGGLVKMNWVEGERGMKAWASYMYDEETNQVICLITARMPEQVIGDPDMDSLGHEFLHCMTGDFHEGEH